jgi:Ca2+-binding RTX toxin-like protein
MHGLGQTGRLQSSLFYAGDRPHDADDRIIYDRSHGALYYDDDGIGSHYSIQIAALSNKPLLSAADFVVI